MSHLQARVSFLAIVVLAAVVLTALPAFAHHPVLSGSVSCIDGVQRITWTVGNSENDKTMTIMSSGVTSSPFSAGLTIDGLINTAIAASGSDQATTDLPGNYVGSVALTVAAVWSNGFTASRTLGVAPAGPAVSVPGGCVAPPSFIIVDKVTDPAGSVQSFEFDPSYGPNFFLTDTAAPNNSGALVAGTYSVAELVIAGWTPTSATCSDQSPVTAIVLSAGETVTCTFGNQQQDGTITLVKSVINDNGGTAGVNAFGLTVGGNAVTSGQVVTVAANTPVAINEAGLAGYTFVNITGTGCPASLGGTVTVPPGQSRTCTITNDDSPASLQLIKQVTKDDGGNAAATDFILSASGPTPGLSGAGGFATTPVNAGTYTLSETGPSGYTGSDWVCVGGTQNGASVTLSEGQSATCTITNDDSPASLQLIKTVVNDNGGAALATDFTLSATGPTPLSGAGGVDATPVDAGTYALSETTDVTGYTASAWVCVGGTQEGSAITLGSGESAVCTITNDDIQPRLIVTKDVVNDNGGTKVPTDFTINVEGSAPSPASFAGTGEGTAVALNAGSYSVSETEVAGYAGTFDQGCSGVIAAGETRICRVTNIDLPPGLTVVKRVINDNGGTKVAADFEISVASAGTDPAPFDGSETGTVLTIDAGVYEVTEGEVDAYDGSFSEGCEGTIALGEARVCTVTNDDVQPVLNVIKRVINDDGGTRTASSFSLFVSDVTLRNFPGSESGTRLGMNAGPYRADELDEGRYVRSRSADCDGSIDIGQTKTCTITNNDKPAEVLGVAIENEPSATVQVLGIELPRTGLNIALWLTLALALVAGGFGSLWISRRMKDAKG
jgi:hypothetical protein